MSGCVKIVGSDLRDLLQILAQSLRSEVVWANYLLSWVSFLIFKMITWGTNSMWGSSTGLHVALCPSCPACQSSAGARWRHAEQRNDLEIIWGEARGDEGRDWMSVEWGVDEIFEKEMAQGDQPSRLPGTVGRSWESGL